MKILAVTCYTGGEDLVAMTERCCESLRECVPEDVDLCISALGQGAERMALLGIDAAINRDENVGFAHGMNAAINTGVRWGEPDYVLCFNNDLEFPEKDWIRKLLYAIDEDGVLVPATDSAAITTQPGPINKDSHLVREASAYCWLVPFEWCKFLKETYGFWLFSEDFAPAYGEDNWTAFLLAKEFGLTSFRYVPRSFVKHLRARTSRIVAHDRAASSRVLIDKFKEQLLDPDLEPELRLWANDYISILKGRSK